MGWQWLVLGVVIVFAAGIVRGLAGFGFSAVCVAGLSLFVPPSQVVPPTFMLEIVASLSMLRPALRHVDWNWLSWLMLGNALCVPLGVALLAVVPETPMRLLIGVLLLLAAGLLRAGVQLTLQPTRRVRLVTGLVSGFINGVAAIGGITVAVMLSSARMPPAAMRATMVMLLLLTDIYALAWAALLTFAMGVQQGPDLLGWPTLVSAMWMTPAMLAGIWVGTRFFALLSPEQFRLHVLNFLLLIAAAGVARAVWSLSA